MTNWNAEKRGLGVIDHSIAGVVVLAGLFLVVSFFQAFASRGQIQIEEQLMLAEEAPSSSVPLPKLNPTKVSLSSKEYVVAKTLAAWKKNNSLSRVRQTVQLSADTYQSELECLSDAIYHEARGETYSGRLAVAQVVLNRVKDRRYPNTVCEVVYQGSMAKNKKGGCQFSFTCDGSLFRIRNDRQWSEATRLAQRAMLGAGRDLTKDATHYHADYVDPVWADNLDRTVQIGTHIFYRWSS